MSKKFYMVWNPSGRAPAYRHPTKEAAITEASRLLGLSQGLDPKFFILEATAVVRRPVIPADVVELSCEPWTQDEIEDQRLKDEIPF